MPSYAVPTIQMISGESVPALGQGTWKMAEDDRRKKEEVAALRLGLDLGMTLIDTAEMYGEGRAEELVAEAIAGRRDDVFLVSKFYPYHADFPHMMAACERSLKRLKTDRLDLYLLHWRGAVPLEETLKGFNALTRSGKVRYAGVSNFDTGDMEEWTALKGDKDAVVNQVLYNLKRRGIEWDLLPWCRERNVLVMAYSPIDEVRLLENHALKKIAARHKATAVQVALAWLISRKVIVIPKASSAAHVTENRAALDLRLDKDDLTALDKAFPPPDGARRLETA